MAFKDNIHFLKAENEYEKVSQTEEAALLECGHSRKESLGFRRRDFYILLSVCLVSMIFNAISLIRPTVTRDVPMQQEHVKEQTPYAKLTWNVAKPWTGMGSPYNDLENHTLTDENWEAINIDAGAVALSDDYAEAMGLPMSQRFPWDTSKGLYLINSFHNMHCLKLLQRSLAQARDGVPMDWPYAHQIHCLDALRQDIMCNADDTPRYTGFKQPDKSSGLGQLRQCRDWNQLEKWAAEHHACYRYINPLDDSFDTLERYKFCPPDSPYREYVEAVFGQIELE